LTFYALLLNKLLDCKEKRVVHELVVEHELQVLRHDLIQALYVVRKELYDILRALNLQEVDVFQGAGVLDVWSHFDITRNTASFEVKDTLDRRRILKIEGVSHQDQVNGSNSAHSNRVHTVNAGHERRIVFLEVELVVWQHFQEKLQLSVTHRFDDEFPVVREKEERATLTGSFSCLENHVAVVLGTE